MSNVQPKNPNSQYHGLAPPGQMSSYTHADKTQMALKVTSFSLRKFFVIEMQSGHVFMK